MTGSGAEVSTARTGWACAGLLVLAMGVHVVIGDHGRDDASYQAGYRAASDTALVRKAVIAAHTTPAALCTSLATQAVTAQPTRPLVQDDFISGCTRAVAEAME